MTHDGLCHRVHHECAVARLEALIAGLVRGEEEIVGTRLYDDDNLYDDDKLRIVMHCDLCGATRRPGGAFRHADWCPYGVLDAYQLRDVAEGADYADA